MASGNWRVQVRRKTRYVAETFRRRKDGEEWALEMERNIDRNGSPMPRRALWLIEWRSTMLLRRPGRDWHWAHPTGSICDRRRKRVQDQCADAGRQIACCRRG